MKLLELISKMFFERKFLCAHPFSPEGESPCMRVGGSPFRELEGSKDTKIFLRWLLVNLMISLPLYLIAQPEQNQQEKKQKGTFYFAWGYNKDWFSKSDLHFSDHSTGNNDFTLYDVKAIDNPDLDQIFNTDVSIPQFIYRFGYYFKDKHNLGIEIGFDHAKYIVVRSQQVHIKGVLNGETIDKDTMIEPKFLQFEHTNGANFLMVSLLKRNPFIQSKNGRHVLNYVLKPGIGVVIPKTDVRLFGTRRDNVYHVAGYIAGLDISLRYEYGRHWFAETGLKGSFANYSNVLTVGNVKANHKFYTLEFLFCFGYGLPW